MQVYRTDFFTWKTEQFGQQTVDRALLSMPLPGAAGKEGNKYTFDQAKEIVLKSFRSFSPPFSYLAKKLFDQHHIDAQIKPYKTPGAYCVQTVPGTLPYITMSFTGSIDEVITLGHELGHAVQLTRAPRARGFLLADTSSAMKETASVFAEQLVFDELMKKEKDPDLKKIY